MEIAFTKMHGLGNDFIVIDCREHHIPEFFDWPDFAKRYCDRRFGIGADQILLLYSSQIADFGMKIFNADGTEVEMCGNGIRCLAKYIWDKGLSEKDILEIETLAGIIMPEKDGEMVRVDMGRAILDPEEIPVNIESEPPIMDHPLKILDREFKITCVSMGNPHAVVFLDEDISDFPVSLYGPQIENHPIFPKRTNVEFVNVKNRAEVSMRVWERGSGETMACGTGASAVGVASMLKGFTDKKVTVHLPGGNLVIEWDIVGPVYMTGPAIEVFEGRIKSPSGTGEEKRRHHRNPCSMPLEFSKKGEHGRTYQGVSIDISNSGIGMVSDCALEVGQVITLNVHDKEDSVVRKAAIVIWCMKIDGKYRTGLMFI
jgi:diaminopimelate epimerase